MTSVAHKSGCVRPWALSARATRSRVITCALLMLALACGSDAPQQSDALTVTTERKPLDGLPRGEEQLANLCSRVGKDDVRDLFCDSVPEITSLFDLQLALEMDSDRVTKLREIKSGGVTAIALSGHSSSLSKHKVSAINPRLFQARAKFPSFRMVLLAFNRGEQEIELISRDRVSADLNFYLISFRQACNDDKHGCTHADLFTDAIEKHWTEVSLYDENDLSNTILDCAPCHQPNGLSTSKRIIMQEFNAPFTHWFWKETEGGHALLSDFMAAHGDQTYGNMSSDQIANSDPTLLPTLILARDGSYKGVFDSIAIENEVKQSSAAEGGDQPTDNRVPGDSITWHTAYDESLRSSALSLPYHDVKVTDTDKLDSATEALKAFANGELEARDLPELSDVFPEDPKLLAELGMTTEPHSDGKTVLLQACSPCHRDGLDPSVSRARFRADLQGMSRAERDLAIERLRLPASDPLVMPPTRARLLTDDARKQAIKALMR